MRLSGVTAPLAFPGGTDTAAFHQYLEEILVPELRPGDVVIWDDLKPHRAEEVVRAVERAGAQVIPLPPWSPDLAPIEELYARVKGSRRSAAARSTRAISTAFCSALNDISPAEIRGWFHDRAAYAFQ
jgi:transposase